MHLGTECLFLEVKSICILHLENLFQGILHHIFALTSLHWNRGVITTFSVSETREVNSFKYKALLTVTKRHLPYK